MTEYQELKQLATDAYKAGKYDIATKAMDKMEAMGDQPAQPLVEPREHYNNPEMTGVERILSRMPSMGQIQDAGASAIDAGARNIVGNVEAGVSLATGFPAMALGGISEAINPGSYDKALQDYTYQPRTDKGQEMLARTGKSIGEPMAAAIDKYGRHGEAVYDATGSEFLGALTEMAPEAAMALLGSMGMRQPRFQPPKQGVKVAETGRLEPTLYGDDAIKSKIVNKVPDSRTAGKTLNEAGEVVKHPLETKAISQGWADNVVVMFKGASESTKSAAREMVHNGYQISKNLATGKHVVDAAGKAMMQPVNRVMGILKQTRSQIDKIAQKSLGNNRIDANNIFGAFEQQVAKLGGVANKEGNLKYAPGTTLFNSGTSAGILDATLAQIKHYGRNPSGYELHKFKQWIYKQVSYEGRKEGGVNPDAASAVKGLAAEMNATLKGMSKSYDKVNTAYSDSIQALETFQKFSGKNLDLTGETVNTGVGRSLKNILKENVNSDPFKASVAEIIRVAEKHSGKSFKYDTDLKVLMEFAAETEKMFGASPSNSFVGSIARAGESGTRGITGKVMDKATGYAINKAMGKNQENALKSMLMLLRSGN